MNEKAINAVISNYAIENANLRIQVASLQAELEPLQAKEIQKLEDMQQNTEENKEGK